MGPPGAIIMSNAAYTFFFAAVVVRTCSAFSPRASLLLPPASCAVRTKVSLSSEAAASPLSDSSTSVTTVFDFTSDGGKSKSIESFERIDDAIMGGISLSALKDVSGEPYASWSGVCRTDGGGFCGMRTLPFKEPLDVGGSDGIFVDCRLASDDEPERRVWKITMRTDSSRGEMVYQAAFLLPKQGDDEDGFTRVKVPLEDFKLVRGPRIIPDGPKLNVTGGIFQIGLSMSKFVIGVNTTELDNFRPGYFDLNIKRIGFYSDASRGYLKLAPLETLSKEEVQKKRPLLLKILLPVAKLFFSEKANRRRSAMTILTKQRGMTRLQAMLFGIRNRAKSYGMISALSTTAGIVAIDSLRTVLRLLLRVILFYPLAAIGKIIRFTKRRIFRMKLKELPKMA